MLGNRPFLFAMLICLMAATNQIGRAQVLTVARHVLTNSFVGEALVDHQGALLLLQARNVQNSTSYRIVKIPSAASSGGWESPDLAASFSYWETGSLAVDQMDNAYVVGTSNEASVISKVDSEGQILWRSADSGEYFNLKVIVDPADHAIMTAIEYTNGTTALCVSKYDTNGAQLWKKRFKLVENVDEWTTGVRSDASGNILVTEFLLTTEPSAVLAKLSPSGEFLWAKFFSTTDDQMHVALIDHAENIVFSSGTLVAKLAPSGDIVWTRPLNGLLLRSESSGEILLNEVHDTEYSTLTKLNATGDIVWRSPLFQRAIGLTPNAGTNYVAGLLNRGYWSEPFYIAAIDNSGQQRWRMPLANISQQPGTLSAFLSGANGRFFAVAAAPEWAVDDAVVLELEATPVTGLPQFVRQPESLVKIIGETATFQAEATGQPPLEYLWYRDGIALAGSNGPTLTVGPLWFYEPRHFFVRVKNPQGEAYSRVATLRVIERPYQLYPGDVTSVGLNSSFTLSGLAGGTQPLEYQWRHNGADLPGQTNAELQLSNITLSAAGDYTVIVSNEGGVVTNTITQLIANPAVVENWRHSEPIGPTNSNFEEQLCTSSGNPAYGVVQCQSMVIDPTGGILIGGTDWTGRKFVLEKLDDNGNTVWAHGVSRIATMADIDAFSDGTVYLSINDGSELLTLKLTQSLNGDAPQIIGQPTPAAVQVGTAVSLHGDATGAAPLRYQWFHGVSAIAGATNSTFSISAADSSDAGTYFLEVQNHFGRTATRATYLDVGLPADPIITDNGFVVAGPFTRVNKGGAITLSAYDFSQFWGPTLWQWLHNGVAIEYATNASLEILHAAATDAGTYSVLGTNRIGYSNSPPIRVYVESRVETLFETTEVFSNTPPCLASWTLRLAPGRHGDMFLGGDEEIENYHRRLFVTRISEAGQRLWRITQPTNDGSAYLTTMLVDSADNLIIAFTEQPSQVVAKYPPAGNALWTSVLEARHNIASLTIGENGDVFVGGQILNMSGLTESIFVHRITSAGESSWEVHLPLPMVPGPFLDTAKLAVGPNGSLYCATGSGLLRISGDGQILWQVSEAYVEVQGDSVGAAYAAGSDVARYSPQGELLWKQQRMTTDLRADSSGVVFFNGRGVEKLSPSGERLWKKFLYPAAMAAEGNGSTYVSGQYYGSYQSFLYGLDNDGAEMWLAVAADPTDWYNVAREMIVCSNGDIAEALLEQKLEQCSQSRYTLRRYRQNANSSRPAIQISPMSVLTTPGTNVCFNATTTATNVAFQWSRGSYMLGHETNQTICIQADWTTEGPYNLAIITDQEVFVSKDVMLELKRPWFYLPERASDHWRIRVLPALTYRPLSLETSTNLITWQLLTNWTYPVSWPLEFLVPRSTQGQQFFRARQIAK